MKYCAIIGDIRGSREIPRRNSAQRRFSSAIAIINEEFSQHIASKFLVTLGDEFQGLLRSPAESYRLVRRFEGLMGRVTFTFGLGVGSLSTPLAETALGMDGEVFHNARAALDKAKKEKRVIMCYLPVPGLDLFNSLLDLVENDWRLLTDRQRQILSLYHDLGDQRKVESH